MVVLICVFICVVIGVVLTVVASTNSREVGVVVIYFVNLRYSLLLGFQNFF